jgi:hypothetical protein
MFWNQSGGWSVGELRAHFALTMPTGVRGHARAATAAKCAPAPLARDSVLPPRLARVPFFPGTAWPLRWFQEGPLGWDAEAADLRPTGYTLSKVTVNLSWSLPMGPVVMLNPWRPSWRFQAAMLFPNPR